MNHINSNRVVYKAFAFIALMIIQTFSATISISPKEDEVITGNSIDIDILISDLGDDRDLSVFDFDLFFDTSILQYSGYNLNINLGDITNEEAFDASSGLTSSGIINLASVSDLKDLSFQPESFKLATVTFKGIAYGISAIGFANILLGDQYGVEMPYTAIEGSVKSVPESSTMILLGSSLSALIAAYFSRKKLSV